MSKISASSDYFRVEKILDKRTVGRRSEYWVKWMGYPESQNTWEPLKNLSSCKNMIKEFEAALKSKKAAATKIKSRLIELPPNKTRKVVTQKNTIQSPDFVPIEMKIASRDSSIASIGERKRRKSNVVHIVPESNEKSLADKTHFMQIDRLNGRESNDIELLLRQIDASKQISKRADDTRMSLMTCKRSIIEPQLTPLISNAHSNHTYTDHLSSKGEKLSKQTPEEHSDLPDLSFHRSLGASLSNKRNSKVSSKNLDDKSTKAQNKQANEHSRNSKGILKDNPRSKSTATVATPPVQSKSSNRKRSSSKEQPVIVPLQSQSEIFDVISITQSGSEKHPQLIARCQSSQRRTIRHTAVSIKQTNDEKISIFSGFGNFECRIDGHLQKDEKDWFRVSLKCESGWQSLGYFEMDDCKKRVPDLLCDYLNKQLKANNNTNSK